MRLRLIFALVAFVLVGHTSQATQIRHFNIGGWYAGAYTNDATGRFSHCAGTATYRSHIALVFSINRTFHWSMGLANTIWRLHVGTKYPVAFSVDQRVPIRTVATVIMPSMIEIPLTDSATLFHQFQNGYVLHVATAKRVFSFNLTNTSKLLPALLECAQNRGRAFASSTNPFASKSLKANAAGQAAHGAEATTFAANLLSLAGISNFKFLTPAELPTFHGDARWVHGTTVGTVDVLPRATPEQLKGIAAALIGSDAKACKGAFLSGAMPAKGSTLAHIFTSCDTNGKSTVVYYLAVPRRAGGAYLISTASFGSEKPAKKTDASLTAAVLRIDGK